MRKIIFLIPILFAYLLILGHSLVPHTHQNESANKDNHHHSAGSHHDHHDTNHENNNDNNDEENNALNDLFSLFFHSPFTNSVVHTFVIADEISQINKINNDCLFTESIPDLGWVFPKENDPPDIHRDSLVESFILFSSLKAPPVC